MSSSLSVVVDGQALPEAEARAVWQRFSAHMDAHRGDFDGFAASAGYASARVAVEGGVPTLTLSTQALPTPPAQRPARPPNRGGGRRRRGGGGERRQRGRPGKKPGPGGGRGSGAAD